MLRRVIKLSKKINKIDIKEKSFGVEIEIYYET